MKHGRWTALLWVTIGLGLTGLLLVSIRSLDSDGGRYAGPMPKPELPPLPVMVGGRIQVRGSTGLDTSQEPTPSQPDAVLVDAAAVKEKTRPIVTTSSWAGVRRISGTRDGWRLPERLKPTQGSVRELTAEEVERKGGIFEAVKTVPGVSGW